MKIFTLILGFVLMSSAHAASDITLESVGLPAMPPLANYLSMTEHSPFSGRPASAVGQNGGGVWELWGLMRIAGKNYAILRRTDTHEFLYLTEKINSQGLRLVSVDFNPDPRIETVTIETNGILTRLGYAGDLLAKKFSAYQKFDQPPSAPKP